MVSQADIDAARHYYLVTTEDPRIVPKDAPRGALALWVGPAGGQEFQKQDDGTSTNWTDTGGGGG